QRWQDLLASFQALREVTTRFGRAAAISPMALSMFGGRGIWVLRGVAAEGQPFGDHRRNPEPIYYGYSDSGFLISRQGKRRPPGHRIGRRPMRSEETKALDAVGLSPNMIVCGQLVIPP